MIPTLPIQIKCPKCGKQYVAQVQSIIDVSQDPQLKAALLRGDLNTVTCPSCGAVGRMSVPVLYHDPQKELLLVFIPPELDMPMADRERLTGKLVNALLSTIPADKRKGYFLNPRTMLTMQSLIDEILKADGITEEMLQQQRARSRLLQRLLAALDDEQQLKSLVEQHKEEIDYPFFLTLAAAAEGSAAAGQKQVAEKLLKLRDVLLAQVSVSLPQPLPLDTPAAQVLDKLLEVKDKESRWAFVLYNRPLLDYAFFQKLTERIEQASSEEAQALRDLRDEVLEMTEQLDKEARAAQEAKIRLLQDALSSPDPVQTLRQRKEELDALFVAILGAALRGAQESGDAEEVKRLQAINDAVLEILQENLPPELRFVNDLLAAEYPQETQKLLQEHQAELTPKFLEILAALADDLEKQQKTQTAQRLRDIRTQAEAMIQPATGGTAASS